MINITEQNYKDKIKQGKFILFAVSKFCGHCMALKPVFNLVAENLKGFTYGMTDLQDEEGLIQVLNVTSMPVVIVYKDGVELGRTTNIPSQTFLEDWIKGLDK